MHRERYSSLIAAVVAVAIAIVGGTGIRAMPLALAVGVLTHTVARESSSWGLRELNATIWYPAAGERKAGAPARPDAPPSDRGPFPLIVYSHGGCGGQPQAIAPAAVAIASAGFVFVQFPHPGSTTDDCAASGERYARGLLERPDDIVCVIDALNRLNADRRARLHGILDSHRVGIMGHSQGAQAALMMASTPAPVGAIMAISPSIAHPDTPRAVWRAIEATHVPVLIVHGTGDTQWTREAPLRAYEALPESTPRAFLEVEGMGHTPGGTHVDIIVRYAIAFFRVYLRNEAYARSDLAPTAVPSGVSLKASRFP